MSTKTFDNVKVKVAFTTATTRANIATGENISTMFGKLSKWYTSFNDVVWTGDADTVSGFTVGANVPADAKFTDTVYTHPTTAGNKHIPSGGASGQVLKWSSSGTAKWAAEYSYTHPVSGVTAGTYRSVTVDANGHVTTGSNPTLTVTQGGTGATDAKAAAFNLIGEPTVYETAITDSTNLTFYYATPSASNGALYARPASIVWTYIKGKADTVYAPKSHTHSISNITNLQTTLDSKLNTSLKGAASGLAELDSGGKVPSSQLPSYVDDVIEGYLSSGKFYKESAHTTQITGETGKIYIDLSTSKTYRWSGSAFAEISSSLALGTTSSTAYRGDRGLIAYNHSQVTTGNPHNVTKSDVGLGNVENKSSATIRGELTKANVTTALGYTPPTKDTVYTHPTYTAKTGVPTANQTPAFGGTFTVTQPVSDATGHITAMNSRTITIPATAMTGATASAAGTKGLVPAPAKGKQEAFLRGDGTWAAPLRQTVMNQSSETPTETPWFKVASTKITEANTDHFITIHARSVMTTYCEGIVTARVRTSSTVGTHGAASLNWITASDIDPSDWVLTYTVEADKSVTYEIWCKIVAKWWTYVISVLNEGTRVDTGITWNLMENTTVGSATYGTPTGVVVSTRYLDVKPEADVIGVGVEGDRETKFSIKSTVSQDVSLVFDRSGADWKFVNRSGSLHIQNNWVDEAQGDWFDVVTFVNATKAVTFTGKVTASSFSGSGASLTSLNASNLSSGTVPIARIPTGTSSTTVALGNHTHSNYYNSSTSRTANTVLAAPNGSDGAASFRKLVAADLPVVPISKGGTGATDAATARTNLGITPANIGAAASSHGTHVEFSTTAPKANGTAAVGTANTVSRSDHVHPLQTTVSGNAGTATKLKTAVKIDGFSFDGSESINHYATCSTAAATVAKVATINTGTFTLATGATVYVKFTNANTATSATLNVNSTGAKPIFHNGAAISASSYIKAGGVYQFVYDGTNWVINAGIDTNTVYTHPTTAGNKHIPSGGSSGQILKWSSDGTATWATEYSYTHPTTAGNKHIPSGGSSGQILRWSAAGTAVWGDDNNTDVNVKQVSTSTATYRPLVLGYSNNTDSSQLIGEDPVTNQVYVNNSLYAKASTGELFATKFNGSGAGLTSLNASNLSSGTVPIARIPTGTSSTTVALGNHTHSNYYNSSTSRTANTVLVAPNGSDGAASFRKLVAADLPTSGATAGTYGESAAKTATHGGTISVPKITVDKYGRVTSASSINITLPSDNNTDTKVTSTLTDPMTSTTYYLPFVTGATTGGVAINNGIKYATLEGTTSEDGRGVLVLGNSVAEGSEGSKHGRIYLYSAGTAYGSIRQSDIDTPITHLLPDVGGTVLNTGNYLNYKGHLRQNVMNQASSTPTSTPWFKIASTIIKDASSHAFGTFAIANGMAAGDVGILHVKVATGSTVGTNASATARWISKTRIDPSTFVITYTETANTSVKYELWCKLTNQWRTYITSIINEGSRTQAEIVWELSKDTSAGSATYGTPTGFAESTHTIDDGPMSTTSNSVNSEQTVFFNDSTTDGTLGYDSAFTYNPSKNIMYVTNAGGTRKTGYTGNGIALYADNSTTWAGGLQYYTADGTTQLATIGAYGKANATEVDYFYMGKNSGDSWLKVAEDQITGYADTVISKTTPTLTLDANGNTAPTIEFKRTSSCWRMMNENGAYVIKGNWDAENETQGEWWQALKISTTGVISGNGSGLTNLNASNISSGTLSSDRLPVVPISKGGTGATTAKAAAFNLIGEPTVYETAITDSTNLTFYYSNPSVSNGALYARPASTLWTYIEPKIEAAYQPLKKKEVTLPATAGWYRIASSLEGINRCHGIFTIEGAVSGRHTTATFIAQSSYGNANSTAITVLTASHFSNTAITKARIVYHTTFSGNYAYLEVYNAAATATKVTTNIDSSIGWKLIDVVAGSIPSGYSNKEVTLSNNTMVATTFSGTASKVTSTLTSTNGTYALTFHSSNSTGSKSLLNNAGIRVNVKTGTTTEDGCAQLYLGNSTASGTAGNQYGQILMYSKGSVQAIIRAADSLSANRTYDLPNASGTIALTTDANKVLQADLACTTQNNSGLRLPLLLGSKNTNPNNDFNDDPREITATTTTSGVNMTGLAWLETSYWTTGGDVGKAFARICASSFKVVGSGGSFEGTATKATKLSYEPTINGVKFTGDANIQLSDEIWGEGTGSEAIIDSTTPVSGYDLLWVETNWGHHIVSATLNQHNYRTYATTPYPNSGGTSNSIIGTIDIHVVSDTSVKATVSNVQIQGSNTTISATKSTLTANITRIIGIRLM